MPIEPHVLALGGSLDTLAVDGACRRLGEAPLAVTIEVVQLRHHPLPHPGPAPAPKIDTLLTEYWQENFKNDPVERVYVVYVFESVFDEPPSKFHLHIHLIPRFMSLDPLLRECPQRRTDPRYPSTINAWTIPFITSREQFPRQYRTEQAHVKALMRWLRSRLEVQRQ